MKVAVLGCGPAGLLAAHAATELECEVDIYSQKQMSQIGGAQYLHEAIPGITDEAPATKLSYVKIGDSRGYAEKVYGSPFAPTSWTAFPEGEYPAWSTQQAYRALWSLYSSRIRECFVTPDQPPRLAAEYDFVLSTIPVLSTCKVRHEHKFTSQAVVLYPQAMAYGVDDLIIYNGRESDTWYRSSKIFGYGWTEWSVASCPEVVRHQASAVSGIKPIDTDCSCHFGLGNFHRLGRFGQWRKAVLISDAYKGARAVLSGEPEVSNDRALV